MSFKKLEMCNDEYFKTAPSTYSTLSTGLLVKAIPQGRIITGEQQHSSTSEVVMVETATAYIHENFFKKISVEEIAKKVFVSQYHFSRIFKKHTRYSPYQYVQEVRLQEATKLMHRKELTIGEVSFQSGFSRVDYFSAAFAKKYEVCPTVYRKKLF